MICAHMGGSKVMKVSPNHPKLDHLSIETYGFGITHCMHCNNSEILLNILCNIVILIGKWRYQQNNNGDVIGTYIIMCIYIYSIYTGWWLSHPSEKYESQLGWLLFNIWKIKNVWNHQPVDIYIYILLENMEKYGEMMKKLWEINGKLKCART